MTNETANPLTDSSGDYEPELIDNLVESKAEPPTPAERPVEPAPAPPVTVDVPKFGNLKTVTQVMGATFDAVRLMNDDSARHMLHVRVYGAEDDYVLLASDSANLSGIGASLIAGGGKDFVFENYTGALYAKPDADNSGAVTVTVWAVTK